MLFRRVSELAGGYVVNDLLCMLEQPYLRRNFVDDIVRLLLDIVKDTKSQVRHCPPTPGHCQGYQEPGMTLSSYSWTLSRIPRAMDDIVRLLLDIVKDTKCQVRHCPPTPGHCQGYQEPVRHCPPIPGHCQGYQEPGTTLFAYSRTLSRIPRARYAIVRLLLDIVKNSKSQVRHCPPTPGHCQGYQEPGTTLFAYSRTLSRIPRARYDIVRLLLDIVKNSKSQVRHCAPTPGHCQGYQEPGTTLCAYSWTLSRIPRARYDIVRLLLDIVKDTKTQVRHCAPTPGHCQEYQEPGTTLSAYSWTLSPIPRARYDPYVFGHPGSGSFSQVRIRIRILLSSSYNRKKNLDSYCFVISL
jgi:BarA-like signal transduction histidine kinase